MQFVVVLEFPNLDAEWPVVDEFAIVLTFFTINLELLDVPRGIADEFADAFLIVSPGTSVVVLTFVVELTST